ncbi:MAG: DUF2855 family protein [Myxococcota bacterium]
MTAPRELVVRRDRFGEARVVERERKATEGEVLFRIERFALTTNNVTYAVLGASYGYWDFFPRPEDDTGIVPVWGIGIVVSSNVEGVPIGRRYYGYWPMADHAVVRPTSVEDAAFVDRSVSRTERPDLYQRYHALDVDPLHEEATTDLELLLRPLFTTAWLLADQLMDPAFADPALKTVVVSSASSKTSVALGHTFANTAGRPRVVGLTSPANAATVWSSGVFDEVVTYDRVDRSLADVAGEGPIAYCDVAGNRSLRLAVHTALDPRLERSVAVGVAHSSHLSRPDRPLPGPKTSVFFVPDRAALRAREWGAGPFAERLAEAFRPYLTWARNRLQVREVVGLNAAGDAWGSLVTGDIDPTEGIVVVP